MVTRFRIKSIFKPPLLLLVILLGGLVFVGCRAGLGAIPRGWSGGVIAGDTLFVGSMKGNLVAISTSDGSRLWTVPLESPESGGGGFGCAPAPTSVAIYGSPAVAADLDLVYVGGYNGKIYAFSFDRGALRWVYPRQGSLDEPIVGEPIVSQGKLYFASADGKVYALDAETGDDKVWEKPFETGDKIWSTPAIGGDTLFIGSFDKKLYAIDTATGKKKWEIPFETGGAIVSTPVVYNNTVYIGSFDRYFYAIDATNGSPKWKFPATEEETKPGNWFWAKPIIHNGVVYASNLDGKVYVLDAESGKKQPKFFDLGSPISSSPVLVDDLLVVVATKERPEEGMVYIIDTNNHQQRPLVTLEEKIYAPLAASRGIIYIHTAEGVLYAVDAQSGAIREFNIE